jgi:hypothetical protein
MSSGRRTPDRYPEPQQLRHRRTADLGKGDKHSPTMGKLVISCAKSGSPIASSRRPDQTHSPSINTSTQHHQPQARARGLALSSSLRHTPGGNSEWRRKGEWMNAPTPPTVPPFIDGPGLGAAPSAGNRCPPPPIYEGQAPALTLSHTTRLHYLPHSMHVAYVAKDKSVVGRVNWQLLTHALKSFTGHYKDGPTEIGVTRCTGEPKTDLDIG